MCQSPFSKCLLILLAGVIVVKSEHLFESLLQRRAKPIRWRWSNDLMNPIKPPDVQRRRRFLPEASMEKWWRTMSPRKDVKLDAITNKETTSGEEPYFRRSHYKGPKIQRLTETTVKEKENVLVLNSSLTVRDETSIQKDRLSPFDNLETLTLPVEPFDKDSHAFLVANYLEPTEKTTYFSEERFPDAFGNLQVIPQQREVQNEDYGPLSSKSNNGGFSPQHDVDSELLRELIIHERHKPSKYEHQSASQRLKESGNIHKPTRDKTASFVEYIVPSVENVVSQVEYADDESDSEGNRASRVSSNVEYVTPVVEFVEPEVEYLSPELNTSRESEEVDPWMAEEETVLDEESLPNENQYIVERFGNDGLKAEPGGTRFTIVGLRREQIRVRRNHARNEQVGVPDQDYPTLEALPVVQFYCGDYMPGYYVDITTRCQVFHICHENGQRSSFLCPVGTVFNQEYLVCDWWYNVDCESSSKYYNSESLQAYSTNNKKQRISTLTEKAVKDPVVIKKENTSRNPIISKSRVSYYDDVDENKPSGEIYRRPKLTNLSQKAINYPVGYAILLREYMKNSLVTGDSNRDGSGLFYHDTHVSGDRDNNKYTPKKTIVVGRYEESVSKFPDKTDHSNVSKYFRSSPQHTGGSKVNTPLTSVSSRNKIHGYKQGAETDRSLKHYIREYYEPSSILNHNRSNKVHSEPTKARPPSLYKKPFLAPATEKAKIRNMFTVRKEETRGLSKARTRDSPPSNAKYTHHTATTAANRYRFIIDPKEAIKPASGKINSKVEHHIKNNNSSIKFRHAESTLKHIKPQINKATFTLNADRGKPSMEERVRYHSSIAYSRDNEGLHSTPGVSKTANPLKTSHREYGERLSIKSRSVPSVYETFLQANGTRSEYVLRSPKQYYLPPVTENPRQGMSFNNINQLKNFQGISNNTYESILLSSESLFNFANVSDTRDISRNNVIEKSENGTGIFYPQRNMVKRDKQKVSVNVQIAVPLSYNNSFPLDKYVSVLSENNTTIYTVLHGNKSSEYASKPENSHFHAMHNGTHNTNQDLRNAVVNFENRNVTKINNIHGGYKVDKVPKMISKRTTGSFYEGTRIAMSILHDQQLNLTVPNTS